MCAVKNLTKFGVISTIKHEEDGIVYMSKGEDTNTIFYTTDSHVVKVVDVRFKYFKFNKVAIIRGRVRRDVHETFFGLKNGDHLVSVLPKDY